MPLAPGETFERYAIDALIGRGGMGDVYRATDTRLGRPVALKVLRSDDEAVASTAAAGGVARLLREARASAAFNHPNTVAIYELGEAEGIPYIAMEFVRGRPLRAFLGDASTPLATKVEWLVDVARALHAAHKAGLVHRDVKPGNIMISDDGVVKVLDFGLAKVLTQKIDPSGWQTQMGQVLGTPKYMAPEQLDGETPDARADQFAYGLVAYELLSGLYAGGPLAPMPKSLEKVVPGLSADVAHVITRTMARRADERFASMEEVAVALRSAALGAVQVHVKQHPSDAPTREIPEVKVEAQSRTVQRTAPISAVSAQAVGAPSVSPPSREGWNRTQPMRAPSIPVPAPVSSAPMSSAPASSDPRPVSSGVYVQTPMSMSAPRPTYASQPLAQPASPKRIPIATLVAIAFAIALVIGIAATYAALAHR